MDNDLLNNFVGHLQSITEPEPETDDKPVKLKFNEIFEGNSKPPKYTPKQPKSKGKPKPKK